MLSLYNSPQFSMLHTVSTYSKTCVYELRPDVRFDRSHRSRPYWSIQSFASKRPYALQFSVIRSFWKWVPMTFTFIFWISSFYPKWFEYVQTAEGTTKGLLETLNMYVKWHNQRVPQPITGNICFFLQCFWPFILQWNYLCWVTEFLCCLWKKAFRLTANTAPRSAKH